MKLSLRPPSFVATVLGCLLAGLVAVPAALPRSPRQMDRLRRLAGVAGVALAVDSPRVRPALLRLGRGAEPFPWLGAEELAGELGAELGRVVRVLPPLPPGVKDLRQLVASFLTEGGPSDGR